MSEYKIVASDLDGTLLDSMGRISPENHNAIRELARRGVYFVPCTGRTLNEMRAELRDDPAVRYIIHSDGAVVYDKQTKSRLTMCIEGEQVGQLLDILDQFPHFASVRYESNVYSDAAQRNDETYDRFSIDAYSRFEVIPWSTAKENFDAFCRSMKEIEMVGVFFQSMEDLETCAAKLEATGDYLIIRWEGMIYCEIVSARAGKGNALLALARSAGIAPEQTVGVGDSTNDMTLIRSAGLGLAMSNACDVLKNVSDAVICSNDEHAIEYILRYYIQ